MTVKMDDYEESDWSVDKRGWLTMREWNLGGGGARSREGTFWHEIGNMTIYQFEATTQSGDWRATTSIHVSHNGRTYYRRWDRVWPNNTLSRLCRRFAADLEPVE